jgi:hypothetical protein
MAEQASPYRIGVSNANLAPQEAASWGHVRHREYLNAVGADGFEWMPVRGLLRLQSMLGTAAASDVVTSLHASFRTASAGDVLRGRRSPKELKFIAGMARADALGPLVRMQRSVGCQLPVVAYPNEQVPPNEVTPAHAVDHTKWQERFASVRFQPTAELLHNWGVLSSRGKVAVNGMKRVMQSRGFDAVCFDTFHWKSERSGYVMPAWEEVLPDMVRDGTVREMHVCPARPDRGGRSDELDLILDGQIHFSEIGDMLTAVRENLPLGEHFDVVLEMPAAATRDNVGVPRDVISAIRGHLGSAA